VEDIASAYIAGPERIAIAFNNQAFNVA